MQAASSPAEAHLDNKKSLLSFWQVVNMNVGFFGIQFSFGLQQSSMSPIYKYLGADESSLPYLWLAGPITGLLVQPLVGAMSDRTVTRWGRRTPYFLVGALMCSLGLLLMPYSATLWMAASLLWILDAANNITMEPYRAYISDRLSSPQRSLGFLVQSGFTGLAQTLAYLTPSLLVFAGMDRTASGTSHIPTVVGAAFLIGAVFSTATVLWSIRSVPELLPDPAEAAAMARLPRGWISWLTEIRDAIVEMPVTMRRLALVKFFQWYALFAYWQYIALAIAHSIFHTTDQHAPGFTDAVLLNGKVGAFYNFVAFVAAFALVPLTRRWGPAIVHAVCLTIAGLCMVAIPSLHDGRLLYLPMLGIGIAWASVMGNPYIMLAGSIPAHRTGVYMGIFNMFIVIPMIIQILTLPLYYQSWLGGNPENVIRLAGALMICAAIAVTRVRSTS